LPFKIPVINMRHVNAYPEIFEWGEPEYNSSVDCWIDSFGGSATSETTVVANDMQWQKTLQVLCDLTLMLDDGDQQPRWVHSRPNFTGMHEGVLVIKGGARLDVFDRATLIQRLTGKLHHSARLLLPKTCPEIVGVATGLEGGTIHRIYYSGGAFHEELVESYQFLTEGGRVEFVRDIFKIALWIAGQTSPAGQLHLAPDVRLKTKNQHHVTLKKDGLIKEFNYDRDYSATIAHIKTIYEAKLPNVEQGVTNYKIITITAVGR
jgi:hypothetical protein